MLYNIKLIKMPTKDPVKNCQYVKKSQEKRKASVGKEQFNKEHTAAQMKHKEKVKSQDIEKFRKEQADYMRDYMKQRRLREKQEKKKGNAMTTLADAIRARKARKELQARAIERATATAEKLGNIANEARELTKGAKRNN
jgi:hypothetical protein